MNTRKKRIFSLLLVVFLLLSAVPAHAVSVQSRAPSDPLVNYLKQNEGFRSRAYSDGAGNWLIGYGCLCGKNDYPNGITEGQADALLRSKLDDFAEAVNKFLRRNGIHVTQGQFDALCALTYNIGTVWTLSGNRLSEMLINGLDNYTEQEIASAFATWCHVGSVPNEQLLVRRSKELSMFFDGNYNSDGTGFRWLICDPAGGYVALSDVYMYRAGKPYGELPLAEREGYTFDGWKTSKGWMLSETDTVVNPQRITAVWTADEKQPEPEIIDEPEFEYEESPAESAEPLVSPFPDVAADAWYAPYVIELVEAGMVSGYTDGSFHPNESVTWGQALKLVMLCAGFPEQTAKSGQHWAEGYRAYAEAKGYPVPKTGALNGVITRDEIADLIFAALELVAAATFSSPYADSNRASVVALYEAGLMQGTVEHGARYFHGSTGIRRSELCAVLTRMADHVQESFIFEFGQRNSVNSGLARSEYSVGGFALDAKGRLTSIDSAHPSHFGIDVSEFQGKIDWKAVAADGVEFAIIRLGYRGYAGTGKLVEDPYFRENLAGARAAGIQVGVYFFSQAISVAEAKEEADFVLERLRGVKLDGPVVFDWEQMKRDGSRTRDPNFSTVTDCIITFCEAVKNAGYTPMMYTNKTMAYLQIDLSRLQGYECWLAWYHTEADYIYAFRMWQYGTGYIRGINTEVDLDIWME